METSKNGEETEDGLEVGGEPIEDDTPIFCVTNVQGLFGDRNTARIFQVNSSSIRLAERLGLEDATAVELHDAVLGGVDDENIGPEPVSYTHLRAHETRHDL